MTFAQFRMQNLEALVDGEPLERTEPGVRRIGKEVVVWDETTKKRALTEGLKAFAVTTTAPTISHLTGALGIASSSLRAYEDGSASPRWEIGPMVELAQSLGLTVEELNDLIKNSAREGALRRARKAKAELS